MVPVSTGLPPRVWGSSEDALLTGRWPYTARNLLLSSPNPRNTQRQARPRPFNPHSE